MPKTAPTGSPASAPNASSLPPTASDLTEALSNAAAFRAAVRQLDVSGREHTTGQEQRADRRFKLQLPVIFDARDQVGFGSTSDVSLGGMFIETDSPRRFGERITVKFRAAGLQQPLTAPAVVRWVEEGRGMGVQFESVRPLVIWALQQEFKELTA